MTDLDQEIAELVFALIVTIDGMAPVERSTFLATLARHGTRAISLSTLRRLAEELEERAL